MINKKTKILIIDDIELNRALLCEMFQSKYEILEAEDGKSALRIIEKEKENLAIVLLDVVMPIMDGFSVLEIMNEKGWIDFVPVIMITAEVSDNVMGSGYELGAMDIINKPFNPNIVNKRVENIIENFAYKNSLEQMVENQARKIREQSERLHENNLRLIDALSSIIEFKNTESAQHVFNIRIITKMLLNKLIEIRSDYHLTQNQIELISEAAAMHDIGKIAVPDSILNKPGKLTSEEFEVIKEHTINGCEILEHIVGIKEMDFYHYCYDICRHHHEKWDGKGYPDGLIGNEISIWAQAVSLADAYDALTSKRVYKDAYSSEVAMRMILNEECGVFNPDLLECLIQILPLLAEKNGIIKKDNSVSTEALKAEKQKKQPMDVSARTLRLLEMERQKYKIISELSDEIIFEYDKENDKIIFSEEFHKITGHDTIVFDLKKKGALLQYIKEEDYYFIISKVEALSPENKMLHLELQLNLNGNGYEWYSLRISGLWDISYEVKCMGYVGKIVNIEDEKHTSIELEKAANYDSLTKIYNRHAVETIISDYLLTASKAAVCFIDIDNFKMVNDRYGHIFGDNILKRIATIVQKNLKEKEVVGRLGGDEFVVYMHDYETKESLNQRLEILRSELKMELNDFVLSGSLGVSFYPENGKDYRELLYKADQALYFSKYHGKDVCHYYNKECENIPFRSLVSNVDDYGDEVDYIGQLLKGKKDSSAK